MPRSDASGLSRRVLARVDSRLRSELDQERGDWLVKVPASPAVRAVWKRYCDTVGVPMGHGLAILLHHELASVVDEDVETLADRLKAREAELEARAGELEERDSALTERDRVLSKREADVRAREREVAAREQNNARVEHDLAQQLMRSAKTEPPRTPPRKLGRNDPCWCQSGIKYKHCHGSPKG